MSVTYYFLIINFTLDDFEFFFFSCCCCCLVNIFVKGCRRTKNIKKNQMGLAATRMVSRSSWWATRPRLSKVNSISHLRVVQTVNPSPLIGAVTNLSGVGSW